MIYSRRRLLFGFAAVLAFGVNSLVPARAEILVGAAKRVITPNPLLPVSGGIGRPHPVHDKRGELMSRAVVLERETSRSPS